MGLIAWLKGVFSKLLNIFKTFVEDAFTAAGKVIIAELKDFAVSAVKDLDLSDLTNGQKREAAIKKIKEEAQARGMNVGESLLRVLVELAVQYVKNAAEDISE